MHTYSPGTMMVRAELNKGVINGICRDHHCRISNVAEGGLEIGIGSTENHGFGRRLLLDCTERDGRNTHGLFSH